MNMVWSMLMDAKLSNKFWAEALNTTMYIHNCVPSKSVNNQALYKRLHSHVLDISKLQPFGCHTFILMPAQLHNKLQPHSHNVIYLGPLVKGTHHRLWVCASNRVTESHDIVFQAAQPMATSPLSILQIPKPKMTMMAKPAALLRMPEPMLDVTHMEGDNDTFLEGAGSISPPNSPIKSDYSLLGLRDQSSLSNSDLSLLNNKTQPRSPERTSTLTDKHAALQHEPSHDGPSHNLEPMPMEREELLLPEPSIVSTSNTTKKKGKAPKSMPAMDTAAP